MEDCIFCKIVRGEISCKKIDETENFLAFFDVNPQVEGHTLIISKKHFDTLLDFSSSLSEELFNFIKQISERLMKEYSAEGFNLLNNNFKSAGQLVDHLHFHILPRKENDGLELSFNKK